MQCARNSQGTEESRSVQSRFQNRCKEQGQRSSMAELVQLKVQALRQPVTATSRCTGVLLCDLALIDQTGAAFIVACRPNWPSNAI